MPVCGVQCSSLSAIIHCAITASAVIGGSIIGGAVSATAIASAGLSSGAVEQVGADDVKQGSSAGGVWLAQAGVPARQQGKGGVGKGWGWGKRGLEWHGDGYGGWVAANKGPHALNCCALSRWQSGRLQWEELALP